MNLAIQAKAIEIYDKLDDDKKAVIAFGMTPIESAQELETYLKQNAIPYEGKDLAVAFMRVANMPNNTHMRV